MAVMEKRRSHLAGMSPATILALVVAASSVISTWAVMKSDIDHIEKRLSEHKQDVKETHNALWRRIIKD